MYIYIYIYIERASYLVVLLYFIDICSARRRTPGAAAEGRALEAEGDPGREYGMYLSLSIYIYIERER